MTGKFYVSPVFEGMEGSEADLLLRALQLHQGEMK